MSQIATATTEPDLEELTMHVSHGRGFGELHDADHLRGLLSVASDLAKRAAASRRCDAPLAKELIRQAALLEDLSDSLCDAMCAYCHRRHPWEGIAEEMRAAGAQGAL